MRLNTFLNVFLFFLGIFIGREFIIMLLAIYKNSTMSHPKHFLKLSNKSHPKNIVADRIDSNHSNKFISVKVSECYGLGSRMKQLASLYGIGKQLDRIPYVHNDSCIVKSKSEVESIFPNIFENIKIMDFNKTDYSTVKFAHSRYYDDPIRLINSTESYLELEVFPSNLPSYKYWKSYKNDILKIFNFSSNLQNKVNDQVKPLTLPESHVLCVHTRRGEFVGHKTLLESRKEFVEAAIQHVVEFLESRFLEKITLIFMGTDPKFINDLKVNKEKISHIHKWKPTSKGEDLLFATNYCNSFIHTASASSYGWWMAFMKKKQGFVFYNSQKNKNQPHMSKHDDYDLFPPDWLMLTYNSKNKTIHQEVRNLV